jgi:hypothetical protein
MELVKDFLRLAGLLRLVKLGSSCGFHRVRQGFELVLNSLIYKFSEGCSIQVGGCGHRVQFKVVCDCVWDRVGHFVSPTVFVSSRDGF